MISQERGRLLKECVDDYVVFDLETTGISARKDEIIEISAVKVEKGKIVDTFSTLVNPKRAIPAAASAVNHITDDMVINEPTIEEILPLFLKFIGESVLIGHNIANFDMKFIWRDVARIHGITKTINNNYIDTLSLSRRVLPELEHHKLVDLANYYNISTEGAHRALNDCIMNQKCYENMRKENGAEHKRGNNASNFESEKICPKCGNELVKRNGIYGEFYGCKGYPNCRYTEKL